jgi:hypothetical protein
LPHSPAGKGALSVRIATASATATVSDIAVSQVPIVFTRENAADLAGLDYVAVGDTRGYVHVFVVPWFSAPGQARRRAAGREALSVALLATTASHGAAAIGQEASAAAAGAATAAASSESESDKESEPLCGPEWTQAQTLLRWHPTVPGELFITRCFRVFLVAHAAIGVAPEAFPCEADEEPACVRWFLKKVTPALATATAAAAPVSIFPLVCSYPNGKQQQDIVAGFKQAFATAPGSSAPPPVGLFPVDLGVWGPKVELDSAVQGFDVATVAPGPLAFAPNHYLQPLPASAPEAAVTPLAASLPSSAAAALASVCLATTVPAAAADEEGDAEPSRTSEVHLWLGSSASSWFRYYSTVELCALSADEEIDEGQAYLAETRFVRWCKAAAPASAVSRLGLLSLVRDRSGVPIGLQCATLAHDASSGLLLRLKEDAAEEEEDERAILEATVHDHPARTQTVLFEHRAVHAAGAVAPSASGTGICGLEVAPAAPGGPIPLFCGALDRNMQKSLAMYVRFDDSNGIFIVDTEASGTTVAATGAPVSLPEPLLPVMEMAAPAAAPVPAPAPVAAPAPAPSPAPAPRAASPVAPPSGAAAPEFEESETEDVFAAAAQAAHAADEAEAKAAAAEEAPSDFPVELPPVPMSAPVHSAAAASPSVATGSVDVAALTASLEKTALESFKNAFATVLLPGFERAAAAMVSQMRQALASDIDALVTKTIQKELTSTMNSAAQNAGNNVKKMAHEAVSGLLESAKVSIAKEVESAAKKTFQASQTQLLESIKTQTASAKQSIESVATQAKTSMAATTQEARKSLEDAGTAARVNLEAQLRSVSAEVQQLQKLVQQLQATRTLPGPAPAPASAAPAASMYMPNGAASTMPSSLLQMTMGASSQPSMMPFQQQQMMTGMPVPTATTPVQVELQKLLENGKISEAFDASLNSDYVGNVVFVCQWCSAITKKTPQLQSRFSPAFIVESVLNPMLRLCLTQQLSASPDADPGLRVEWLSVLLMHYHSVDINRAFPLELRGHVPTILNDVDTFLASSQSQSALQCRALVAELRKKLQFVLNQ